MFIVQFDYIKREVCKLKLWIDTHEYTKVREITRNYGLSNRILYDIHLKIQFSLFVGLWKCLHLYFKYQIPTLLILEKTDLLHLSGRDWAATPTAVTVCELYKAMFKDIKGNEMGSLSNKTIFGASERGTHPELWKRDLPSLHLVVICLIGCITWISSCNAIHQLNNLDIHKQLQDWRPTEHSRVSAC